MRTKQTNLRASASKKVYRSILYDKFISSKGICSNLNFLIQKPDSKVSVKRFRCTDPFNSTIMVYLATLTCLVKAWIVRTAKQGRLDKARTLHGCYIAPVRSNKLRRNKNSKLVERKTFSPLLDLSKRGLHVWMTCEKSQGWQLA